MEYELYHYGRKGMRWYQNIFTKGKEASAARKKRKAEKAKAAEEKRKESVEEQKTRIRNSRSAEQVYKNAHLFNDKELTEIYNRLNTENNIKNLIPAKVNKGKKFIENTASTAKNISTLVGNTTDMINKFKDFGKLFGGSKASDGKTGSKSDDKGTGKTKDNKPKSESKPKPKAETAFEILDKVSNAASSSQTKKAPDILNYDDFDATAAAKALTNNIGSKTVNWAMSNPARIESGASFVNSYLPHPSPNR